MKAINLQINDRLHGNLQQFANDRDLPLVVAIRLILNEFFRNSNMNTQELLPEGVIDMGDGKGLLIDMAKLRDTNGIAPAVPHHLPKEQLLAWIRKRQKDIKQLS